MNRDFQVKDDYLLRYFHKANSMERGFEHISREENTQADMLSKLRSGKEKGQLKTVIRHVLSGPSVECLAVGTQVEPYWRTQIRKLM